ncbi:MAG: apolipoprotein acyltransferase [Rhodobacteraceae bacterium]|nr:apolipoprotein acyltransferase [Paracoccaceae bacterium]
MIIIAAALIGAVTGGLTAKRRGGAPADIAQYAVAYGIAFAVIGLFATVIVDRVA